MIIGLHLGQEFGKEQIYACNINGLTELKFLTFALQHFVWSFMIIISNWPYLSSYS